MELMADDSPVLPALLGGAIGVALLASLAKNVRNHYYKGQTVHLDGYTFDNCCFHNCTVVTDTGAFALTGCTFINCMFNFGPNATRIIKLWNTFNVNIRFPAFNPTVQADGSVNIT